MTIMLIAKSVINRIYRPKGSCHGLCTRQCGHHVICLVDKSEAADAECELFASGTAWVGWPAVGDPTVQPDGGGRSGAKGPR